MPSGFSAGFSRGLAGVLKTSREQSLRTQSEEADRALRANLAMLGPAIQQGIESDDYTFAERILTEINPDFVKRFKKEGSPFAALGPLLREQYDLEQGGARGSAAVESAPDAVAGPLGPRTPAAPPVPTPPPGGPGVTPSGDATGAGPTLFGDPFGISSEERAKRATEADFEKQMVGFDVRRRVAEQQGLEPGSPEWEDFVKYGTRPSGAAGQTPTLGTIEDFMTRKATEKGAAPTSNDVAIWRTEWEAMNDADASPALGSFEDYVTRYAGDRNVTLDDLTSEQIEDARQRYATAGKALTGGETPQDLAAMVAGAPDVLQGLTPTLAGTVMNEIAKNPVLRRQYDRTRMEPIRAQAETVIAALDQLLDVNEDDPSKTRLSSGAAGLYGPGLYGRALGYIPGSKVADARAALDQITGQLVLSVLAEMKAQSRTGATGFGQLSNRELDVIEAAATMLKGNISEGLALEKLKELREKFQLVLLDREEAGAGAPRQGATADIIDLDTPIFIGADGRPSLTAPGGP